MISDESLALARQEGIDEALLQVAASNLPVTPRGLARMLTDDPGADDAHGDVPAAERAIHRLAALGLIQRDEDGAASVRPEVADALARHVDPVEHQSRRVRSGLHRWWRVRAESDDLEDGIEAVRCSLAGLKFDAAAEIAYRYCFDALGRAQQTHRIAALAAEDLEALPEAHPGFAPIADAEARANLTLGFTDRALQRYQRLLGHCRRLAEAEPDRVDYQRRLSVSYNNIGDLYRWLGQGDLACHYIEQDLAIAERLAAAEPDRADYQRELVISLVKLSELDQSAAVEHLKRALSIVVRMQARGQLAPVDGWMIEELERRLRERGVES